VDDSQLYDGNEQEVTSKRNILKKPLSKNIESGSDLPLLNVKSPERRK